MISFKAVGDVMLGEYPVLVGRSIRKKIKKHGAKFIFEKIKPCLKSDLLFFNLEAPICDKDLSTIYKRSFKAPSEAALSLKDAGFNIASIANNHMMQYGKKVFIETKNILEKNRIAVIKNPTIITKNNIKLAFFAYAKTNDKTPLDEKYDFKKIIADIEKIKAKVDHIIISLHWGDEYMEQPSSEQIYDAHKIIDAGASMILGHHPHVLQPVEIYKNKIIAYSLGNFVFDLQWMKKTHIGMILSCDMTKDKIINIKLIKTRINKNFQPEFAGEIAPKAPGTTKNYKHAAKKVVRTFRIRMYLFMLKNLLALHPMVIPALFWMRTKRILKI